jgi:hypothetical protein
MAESADPREVLAFMLKAEAPRVQFLLHSGHSVNEDEEFALLARNRKLDRLALKEEKEYQLAAQFNGMSEKTHLRVVKFSVELDRLVYTLESLWQ